VETSCFSLVRQCQCQRYTARSDEQIAEVRSCGSKNSADEFVTSVKVSIVLMGSLRRKSGFERSSRSPRLWRRQM
jgi:hypothetical protein